MWLRASVVFLAAAVALAGGPANSTPEECPFTQVNRYRYFCNTTGAIQAPAALTASKTSNLLKCVEKCHANKACKSYRYTQSTLRCELFSKYLVYMDFDPNLKKPGFVSDRDCYTKDCNVINSCVATDQCQAPYNEFSFIVYEYIGYMQYACDYGYRARTFGFNYTEYDLYDYTYKAYYSYDLNTACGAVQGCVIRAFEETNNENPGTMDVHWNIQRQKWTCRVFHDLNSSASISYSYLEQYATPRRYTAKDSNVGMGFGYWKIKSDFRGY